jgi:hypothetical protein
MFPVMFSQFRLLKYVPSPKKVSPTTFTELTVRAYRVLVVICPEDIVFVEILLNVGSVIPSTKEAVEYENKIVTAAIT